MTEDEKRLLGPALSAREQADLRVGEIVAALRLGPRAGMVFHVGRAEWVPEQTVGDPHQLRDGE